MHPASHNPVFNMRRDAGRQILLCNMASTLFPDTFEYYWIGINKELVIGNEYNLDPASSVSSISYLHCGVKSPGKNG